MKRFACVGTHKAKAFNCLSTHVYVTIELYKYNEVLKEVGSGKGPESCLWTLGQKPTAEKTGVSLGDRSLFLFAFSFASGGGPQRYGLVYFSLV